MPESSYKGLPEDSGGDPPLPGRGLRAANVAAFILCLASNGWAGSKIGAVSHKYPNAIVPDGWAFGIWGIIYTGLTGFVLYQAVCKTEQAPAIVSSVGWLWCLSNLFNSLWIVLFVQVRAGAIAKAP